MSRNLELYLNDILVACEKVLRYTDGIDFEQFVADDRTFDAVIRNLQIIGEAVKNLPATIVLTTITTKRSHLYLSLKSDRPFVKKIAPQIMNGDCS